MFFFKANFNFSDDSEVINVFYMCNVVICCAASMDWTGISKAGSRSLIILGRLEFYPNTNWAGLNLLQFVTAFFALTAHARVHDTHNDVT